MRSESSRIPRSSRRRRHRRHRAQQRRQGRVARLEQLEIRTLLASVIWDGGGDGLYWSDPQNWQNNLLPASGDDVVINQPGTFDIRLDIDTSLDSLQLGGLGSNPSLVVQDATLTANQVVVQPTAILTLNDAAIDGRLLNTGQMIVHGTSSVDVYDDSQWGGNLSLVGTSLFGDAELTVDGDFVNRSTINLTDDGEGPADARR